MGQILVQGGYMMLCAAGSLVCNVICVYLASRVAAGLSHTLREKVFNQALDLSRGDVDRFGAASLVNRCTNDITQIQNLVSMGLSAIVKAPVMAIWAVVKIVGFGWEWTLATAVAALSIALMLALTVVVCIPRFQKVQGLTDVLNRLLREHLTGVRPVRAYNAEGYERERFSGANDELTDNNLIANRVMAIMNPGMTLVTSGLTLAVYWIGAVLIEAAAPGARLTLFSQMVVFSNYGMQVVLAFVLLNMIFVLLPRAQMAAERVSEVIEVEPAVTDGVGVLDSDVAAADRGRIEFRDVSFTYPDDGTPGLSHVSFTVEPGQTVAVVGATGSGRMTLVQLVDRLFDATEGQVLVDGRDVRGYTLEELHCRIGYIPQTATLFKGTVASNVAYGKTDHEITRDDVGAALAVAQSTDFVEGMEGGLNAAIEQGGRNVSGGQRQRLAMGRAIARRPEVLVFDDSFSALDFATDRKLREALARECAGTTKLIVAQRVSTVRDADLIVVLDGGSCVGVGTHDELMRSCPTYREIVSSQLSKEEIANAWPEQHARDGRREHRRGTEGRPRPRLRPPRPVLPSLPAHRCRGERARARGRDPLRHRRRLHDLHPPLYPAAPEHLAGRELGADHGGRVRARVRLPRGGRDGRRVCQARSHRVAAR